MIAPPKTIYLQLYGADKEDANYDHSIETEPCWSEERIFDTDVEYIKATKYYEALVDLREEIEKYKRGEIICAKCGLRQDSSSSGDNVEF